MSNLARLAVAAIVIVIAGFGVTRLLAETSAPGVGANPSPSPSASATPPAPTTLAIVQPFAVDLRFAATTAWRLWGDISQNGKGWYKISVDPPDGLGVTVWKVSNARADPCTGPYMDPPLGPSVDDLADVLVAQPFTKVLEDSPVTLDGYSGRYLEYTAEWGDCSSKVMQRWQAEGSTRDALDGEHDQVWILDVDGNCVVIDAFDFADTSAADRAELRAVVESVQIGPD